MADEFAKPPFKNASTSVGNFKSSNNYLASNVNLNVKGLRNNPQASIGFLNQAFPGRTRFFELGDDDLKNQFRSWTGADGPNDDTRAAIARQGIVGYDNWFSYAGAPVLRKDWKPDPNDLSLTDSPFVPSPTSPQINEEGRPVSDDITTGYGRLRAPDGYGTSLEEKHANNYKAGFVEDETVNKNTGEGGRIVRLFQRSVE
jgi:hypothetical protein